MYQKCPICGGSGKTHINLSNGSQDICKTCNGKTIISELTGLPPKSYNPNQQTNFVGNPLTDFRDNCEQFEDK